MSIFGAPSSAALDDGADQQPLKRSKGAAVNSASSHVWTATRCQRLLRPLLSNIASLKRYDAANPAGSQNDGTTLPRKRPADPKELTSNPLRKKIRYTYSLKSRQSRISRDLPSVPGKARHHDAPRPCCETQQCSDHSTNAANCTNELPTATPMKDMPLHGQDSLRLGGQPRAKSSFETELSDLRSQVTLTRGQLYESIFRAFESILRATSEQESDKTGSRSLLAMCLRKVPTCIAENEQDELEEEERTGTRSAIKGSKASFEMYNDLEAVGTAGGWRHLRQVVRAHSVRMLCEALQCGIFDIAFSRLLLRLCLAFNAHREAEEILSSMIDQQLSNIDSMSSAEPTEELPAPFYWLSHYALVTGRHSFVFRKLLSLFRDSRRSRILQAATESQHFWSLAIVGLTLGEYEFAVLLLSRLCSGSHPTTSARKGFEASLSTSAALKQAHIDALSRLAAQLIIGQRHLQEQYNEAYGTSTMSDRIISIIVSSLAATENLRKGDAKRVRFLLHLTLFLAGANSPQFESPLQRLATEAKSVIDFTLATTSQADVHSDDIMALLSPIAERCSRVDLGTPRPHEHLMRFCNQLAGLDLPPEAVQRIRINGSFLVADRTNSLHDLVLAEKLKASHASKEDVVDGKAKADKPAYSGYRWEETISEWVVASPEMPRRKLPVVEARSSRSRSSTGSLRQLRTTKLFASSSYEDDESDKENNSDSDIDVDRRQRTRRQSRLARNSLPLERKRKSWASPLPSPDPDDDEGEMSEDDLSYSTENELPASQQMRPTKRVRSGRQSEHASSDDELGM